MKEEEKIVEIARFQFPAEAYTLMTLLESEGINCYLRNETTSSLLSNLEVGGARVEVLESDVPEAMKIMQKGGFDIPAENDLQLKDMIESNSPLRKLPIIGTLSLPVQIILYTLLIIIFLLIILAFGGRI